MITYFLTSLFITTNLLTSLLKITYLLTSLLMITYVLTSLLMITYTYLLHNFTANDNFTLTYLWSLTYFTTYDLFTDIFTWHIDRKLFEDRHRLESVLWQTQIGKCPVTDIGRYITPVGAENIQTKIFNKKLIGNEKNVPPFHFTWCNWLVQFVC